MDKLEICSPKRTAGAGVRLVAIALLGLAQAGCLPAASSAAGSGPEPRATAPGGPRAALGQLPLYFIANRGQLDSPVAYYVEGRQTGLYFTAEGVTFALHGPAGPSTTSDRAEPAADAPPGWAVKLDFVGASPGVEPVGRAQTPAVISYFRGPREEWRTGLPTYGQVLYADLWPGIDLVYSGTVNRVKYDFVVKPGADPNRIRLAYRGASDVRLTEAGQLEVSTPAGGFVDEAPYAYQEVDGRRAEVTAAYEPEAGTDGTYQYGFRVGAYDPARPLVLDPAVLVYAGFIGGGNGERGNGIAVDGAGNAYVVGTTESPQNRGFPVKTGPDLTYSRHPDPFVSDSEAFVAKVKADGSELVYAGYIGGAQGDEGAAIAVDADGNAYVTGGTGSSTGSLGSFPAKVGPDLTYNGGGDAFVAKVAADGTDLVYAGYIGGDDADGGRGIAVDTAGSAYVIGTTSSGETTFPVAVGPDLTYNGQGDFPLPDAFVAKVRADGSGLVYAGYIGGSAYDVGQAIAVDGAGHAYVTGDARSDEGRRFFRRRRAAFPVKTGPDLTYNGGELGDAFVAKVKADGSELVYAGYIGGSGTDRGRGIAVDGQGNAYVTGSTGSTEASFPVKAGPDLTFNGGRTEFDTEPFDAFVAKVKADGTGLVYAGYLGGSEQDEGLGIAVDGAGSAHVTGYTGSDQGSFPVLGGPDLTYNGNVDAFVAKVKVDGTGLVQAGYLGGSNADLGYGIALDGNGNAYLTGETGSDQGSFPVNGGPDLTYNGDFSDAFVVKVDFDP